MSSCIITTNDGSQYKKPGIIKSAAGIFAGTTLSAVIAAPLIVSTNKLLNKVSEINLNTIDDMPKVAKSLQEALSISGMDKKDVKIINTANMQYIKGRNLKKIEKHLKKFISKKQIQALEEATFPELAAIKGKNAFFVPIKNEIMINTNNSGLLGFHEIGHAINLHASKFWRTIQKLRNPFMIIASLSATIAIYKRKKAEGEKPKGIFHKTTTFIKNNVGKITTLSFLPIIAEELKATARGNKLAKQLLSPELYKKVVKANGYGASTYIFQGIIAGLVAFLANSIKDFIASPQKIQ